MISKKIKINSKIINNAKTNVKKYVEHGGSGAWAKDYLCSFFSLRQMYVKKC